MAIREAAAAKGLEDEIHVAGCAHRKYLHPHAIDTVEAEYMPFSKDVKARIFVRSARICCLCYKQCGTNIEAAHIIEESKGGANTDDNAIPVCLDCHQEIGAYDDHHPLGNRFTPMELKARRDQLYELVESGAIQAQIIANRLHMSSAGGRLANLPATEVEKVLPARVTEGSREAEAVLNLIVSEKQSLEALPYKLDLLSEGDRAYILDALLERFDERSVMTALMAIMASGRLPENSAVILMEQILRKVTLLGDAKSKANFMNLAPVEILQRTEPGLRMALFADAFDIMKRDQYSEVNLVTPAVTRIESCLPKELTDQYLAALLSQIKSDAWQGAPAARAALGRLPDDLALKALTMLDPRTLISIDSKHMRGFLQGTERIWPEERRELFKDYLFLDAGSLFEKHWRNVYNANGPS